MSKAFSAPHLRLLTRLALGDLLFHDGRDCRVVKVKRRGDRWLVWLA